MNGVKPYRSLSLYEQIRRRTLQKKKLLFSLLFATAATFLLFITNTRYDIRILLKFFHIPFMCWYLVWNLQFSNLGIHFSCSHFVLLNRYNIFALFSSNAINENHVKIRMHFIKTNIFY